MAHSLRLARWQAALRAPGCPVCRLAQEAGRDFLVNVLREGKAHELVYRHIRDAGGFCEDHTRFLRQLAAKRPGDRRCIDRLYGWLLGDLVSGPAPREPCPGCQAAEKCERVSLATLRDVLHPHSGDPDLRGQIERGEGLCREHLVRAASRIEDGESLRLLIDAHARAWDMLSHDLKEYLRKHDYRFSHEAKTPVEEQSWVQAVASISGTQCVSSLRRAMEQNNEPD